MFDPFPPKNDTPLPQCQGEDQLRPFSRLRSAEMLRLREPLFGERGDPDRLLPAAALGEADRDRLRDALFLLATFPF